MQTMAAATAYGTACPGAVLYQEMDKLRSMTGLARPPWLV